MANVPEESVPNWLSGAKKAADSVADKAVQVLEEGPIVLVEDIGQGLMDEIQTPEGIAGAKVKAKINAKKVEVGKATEDIKGNTSAAKLGSTNQTVQSFTKEDIIDSLDGVTEK